MSEQYIGYSVEVSDEAVPVSAAGTKEEALSSAIRRVLSLGILSGGVSVRKLDDPLSEAEWDTLRKTLDAWFAEKGIH
jgi:hypothetical protein